MIRQLVAASLVLAFAVAAQAGPVTYKIRIFVDDPAGRKETGKEKEKKAGPVELGEIKERAAVGKLALARLSPYRIPSENEEKTLPDVEVQAVTIRGKSGYRVAARVVVLGATAFPGFVGQDPLLVYRPLKAGEMIRLPLDAKKHFWAEVSATVEPGLVDRQPNLVPALLKVLGRDEPETSKSAVATLTALGADAVPALLDGVGGDNKLIQYNALRVLQAIIQNDQVPADEIVPPVLKLVNGTDRDLRAVALGTLVELARRDRQVARDLVPTVVRLLEDPDDNIRRSAAATLEIIVQKGD